MWWVAGSAGTGKSSVISVLVDALCLLPHNHGTGGFLLLFGAMLFSTTIVHEIMVFLFVF